MMTLTADSATEDQLHERDPDAASELLVAQLVLDDIAAVQTTRQGKACEGTSRSDEEVAFDLQAASLRAFIGVSHDFLFASSVDRAIRSDTCLLERLDLVERSERDDRRAAVALGYGHDLPRQTSSQQMMEQAVVQPRESPPPHYEYAADTTDEGVINMGMENIHIASPDPDVIKVVPRQEIETVLECVICGDDVVATQSFKAPCEHHYCRDCIVNLVETCLHDERLHPLRCCHKPLPLMPGVFEYISISLRLKFLVKRREYATPPASRVYCSNPRCSAFLDASGDVKRDLTCGECETITCSQCKNNAHPGHDCSENRSLLVLREMATVNKWQTCPGCHAIVELSQGCYHITCRCSTQFCYLCSARWRTCDCRQWDEDRLLNDAERRVRNEFGNHMARAQPAAHAERVHRRMEALRENHECRDHFWIYRHGRGECEECGDFLPIFLMRCVNCQTLACRRCSVNRL